MELYYEPDTNLLRLVLLNYSDPNVHEVDLSLRIIKEHTMWNFSKKLLLDSTKAIYGTNRDALAEQARRFIDMVTRTPIRKVARLKSHSKRREAVVAKVFQQVCQNDLDIKFREFTAEKEALTWLGTSSGHNQSLPALAGWQL